MLDQVWRRVDPDLLAVGVHYYVDGLSHAEIARIIGVSRRTVGNRVTELQKAVRALSEAPEGGE